MHDVAARIEAAATIITAATSVLFHWTMLSPAHDILVDGKFKLLTSNGSQAEREYSTRGYEYYLSTTRSKVGGYHVNSKTTAQAMFVIRGDALALHRDFVVRPIEYWNVPGQKPTWLQRREGGSKEAYPEMEDRVFSRNPTMPCTPEFVASIHIVLPKLRRVLDYFASTAEKNVYKDEANDGVVQYAKLAKDTILMAKRRKIPVYFYDDHNAWLTQNPKKRASILTFENIWNKKQRNYLDPIQNAEPASEYDRLLAISPKSEGRNRSIVVLRELLNIPAGGNLSQRAKSRLKTFQRNWNIGDSVTSIDADIHSDRRHSHDMVDRLNKDMKRYGIKNTKELVEFILNKWAD